MENSSPPPTQPRLVRRLGLFDATMIVMGGIIGSGIFINPYVVARLVNTPFLILGVWALGGLIALAAAFIWAELAALRPEVGGQYAYLTGGRRPIRISTRGLSPISRISVRLGPVAGDSNRRHGGRRSYVCSLLR